MAATSDIEQSVRDRLYGERTEIRPVPCRGDALGRLCGGRYRLEERIGAGGMGSVYRARDERLKRDVAVKVIAERLAHHPPSVKRFRKEAEISARLAHPNVVAILDAGAGPRDFLVMELVEGPDAATLVRRQGPLAAGEGVHVVAQICEALAYAHDRDVIHRDVSPGNILIGLPDLTAKLADFGVASDSLRAVAGEVTGTPGFIAPEVLDGAPPSPRSDLFSLGVLAYRLLAAPQREDPAATGPLATASPRLPPLAETRPRLPRGVCEAVHQAMAREPEARQRSVAEFRAQLVGTHRGALIPFTAAA